MSDAGDRSDALLGHAESAPDLVAPGSVPEAGPEQPEGAGAAPAVGASSPLLLNGRYLLEERIASGGMASVWRAHDEVLARTVAVKVLHDHLAADDAFRERFRREAVAAAKLSHPNVVGLYDTGVDDDRTYLVMEFVDGSTLRDVIAQNGALAPGQVAAIGEKVARALDFAHERGLIHRDIKPANILIGEDGAVKVADFGIAKLQEDTQQDLTRTGMVLGTAAYVAPEQILAQVLTPLADQYSLGCVLYEAISGQRPFSGDSAVATAAARLEADPLPVRSLRPDVPRGLDAILLRTLARAPSERFSSAAELADNLAAFADSDPDETAALATTGMGVPPPLPELIDADNRLGPAPGEPNAQPTPRRHRARPAQRSSQRSQESQESQAPSHESFFRSEGRWLAPVAVLLALAAVLVAVGLGTGVLETGGGFPNLFARDDTPAPDAQQPGNSAALMISGIQSFDPQGDDGRENNDELPGVLDDDPATGWRTVGYGNPAFGNLKDGVGFYVDLGAVQRIDRVELTTLHPGFTYEVRTAQSPAPSIDGWTVAVPSAVAQERTVSAIDGVRAQYVLIWVTGNLQPEDGRFRAEINGLTVVGGPA